MVFDGQWMIEQLKAFTVECDWMTNLLEQWLEMLLECVWKELDVYNSVAEYYSCVPIIFYNTLSGQRSMQNQLLYNAQVHYELVWNDTARGVHCELWDFSFIEYSKNI